MARFFWTTATLFFCLVIVGLFVAAVVTSHGSSSEKLTGIAFIALFGLPLTLCATALVWDDFGDDFE